MKVKELIDIVTDGTEVCFDIINANKQRYGSVLKFGKHVTYCNDAEKYLDYDVKYVGVWEGEGEVTFEVHI